MPAKKSGERQGRRYDRSVKNKKKPSGEELQDVLSDLSQDVGQLIKKLARSGTEFFKKLGEGQEPKRKSATLGGLENLFKQFGVAFKESFGSLGFESRPPEDKPKRKRKKG